MGVRIRTRRTIGAALAAIALASTAIALTSGSAAATTLNYVALGDSSAAGPLIPNQIDLPCTRSDHNWPHVVAAKLSANLTDVTCSGAKLGDLTGMQFGFVPPQFNALKADTDLVTVAITANDINMGTVVPSCFNPLPEPAGISCKDRYTAGGVDQLAAAIDEVAPALGKALDAIHQRSPRAKVYVVGYLTYWQPGGCWPADPIWARDADYLQATWNRSFTMMSKQASTHGARYMDIATPSAAHGLCAPIAEKWLEGLLPSAPAAPYHPNATGMAASGATIAAAIRNG